MLDSDCPGPVPGDAMLGVRLRAIGRPAGALVAHGPAIDAHKLTPLPAAAAPTVAGLVERRTQGDPAPSRTSSS